ncbi:MAG: type II toxin-antitoxin system RelE/ParE family toxin [Synergistaceae bacterium]|nr:type II toxin-antitoxin system RelE/ParE family toxin [Synergistaceae bacterium]
MNWRIRYLKEVERDLDKLDGSQVIRVRKAIAKTQQNPLPRSKGGYGIELGNKGNVNLTGYLEIKLRGEGLRVIYKLVQTKTEMLIIIIGAREGEEVYDDADERIKLYRL